MCAHILAGGGRTKYAQPSPTSAEPKPRPAAKVARNPTTAMSVIPLTLTISLCLVFTFVIFFLKENSRRRFSSVEREALLPLAEETPRLAAASSAHDDHDHGDCGCKDGRRAPCPGCLKSHASRHA